MQRLRDHLNSLPATDQSLFARRCGTTVGYLRKALSTGQVLGAELCTQIEIASDGAVRRWHLRPDDWHRIWPELIRADGSPTLQKETAHG